MCLLNVSSLQFKFWAKLYFLQTWILLQLPQVDKLSFFEQWNEIQNITTAMYSSGGESMLGECKDKGEKKNYISRINYFGLRYNASFKGI